MPALDLLFLLFMCSCERETEQRRPSHARFLSSCANRVSQVDADDVCVSGASSKGGHSRGQVAALQSKFFVVFAIEQLVAQDEHSICGVLSQDSVRQDCGR